MNILKLLIIIFCVQLHTYSDIEVSVKLLTEYHKSKYESIKEFLAHIDLNHELKENTTDLVVQQIYNTNDIIVLLFDQNEKYSKKIPISYSNDYAYTYINGNKSFIGNKKTIYLKPMKFLRGAFFAVITTTEVVHGVSVMVEYKSKVPKAIYSCEKRLSFH